MSNEHRETLEKARAAMVEVRRNAAASLAGAHSREGAPRYMREFIDAQATIDAIDRALEDEA